MTLRPVRFAMALLLAVGPLALAQQPQPSGQDGRTHNNGTRPRSNGNMEAPSYNIMPEGMPNLWWRIPGLAQKIGLTAEQQKRMDDIFNQSLAQLIHQARELHKERDSLQSMLDDNPPDTAKILPQLDHMAQSRAALELVRDKVLLNIRTVLTPDQWNKLQAENRRWQAEHPSDNSNDHRSRDHNFQGKPGGGSQPAQPPA